MKVSTCCNARIIGSLVDPICSACKEHCEYYKEDEDEKDQN